MAIIYSLPLALQFPLFSLALIFWVLLLTYMTNRFRGEKQSRGRARPMLCRRPLPKSAHEITRTFPTACRPRWPRKFSPSCKRSRSRFKSRHSGPGQPAQSARQSSSSGNRLTSAIPGCKAALGRKVSDTLATHLLQAWLLGAHKPMLCDFLDAVGIKRDEDGTVEDLPDSPAKEKMQKAVDQLVAKFPAGSGRDLPARLSRHGQRR